MLDKYKKNTKRSVRNDPKAILSSLMPNVTLLSSNVIQMDKKQKAIGVGRFGKVIIGRH